MSKKEHEVTADPEAQRFLLHMQDHLTKRDQGRCPQCQCPDHTVANDVCICLRCKHQWSQSDD